MPRARSALAALAYAGRAAHVLARVVNELIRAGQMRDLLPWDPKESSVDGLVPIDPARYNQSPTVEDLAEILRRSS